VEKNSESVALLLSADRIKIRLTEHGDLWTQQTTNYFRSNDAIKGLLDANS